MLDDIFQLIIKRRFSNDYFEFINKIAIKYWLWNALLQKSAQANIVLRPFFKWKFLLQESDKIRIFI